MFDAESVPPSRDAGGSASTHYDPGSAERRARALRDAYGMLDGLALLEAMLCWEFRGRIALVSSFGAESAVLLDLAAHIDPAVPVIFLDTDRLFPETLAYHEALVARLGLRDVRRVVPHARDAAARDADGMLWRRAPDLCCNLRKVAPLEQALAGFDAWITGRKRFHGGERRELETIEAIDGRIKINPLAHWSRDDVETRMRTRGLPRHPLVDRGFSSIGCRTCTHRAGPEDDVRAGRWAGSGKTECGIHGAKWARERTTERQP
jgi:phosphoadenosine phosphosulfate reductase